MLCSEGFRQARLSVQRRFTRLCLELLHTVCVACPQKQVPFVSTPCVCGPALVGGFLWRLCASVQGFEDERLVCSNACTGMGGLSGVRSLHVWAGSVFFSFCRPLVFPVSSWQVLRWSGIQSAHIRLLLLTCVA